MAGLRTRIAPTPSGFLHAGNAWSFLLAWLCARSRGGSVHLRIDDLDAARMRPEYLDDIFASLAWLGLDWDSGPRDAADFRARFSQSLRLPGYRAALAALRDAPAGDGPSVFPCACGREKARRESEARGTPGIYAGACREAGLDWARAAFPGAAGAAGSASAAARAGKAPGGDLPLRARVPGDAEATLRTFGAPLACHPGREMGDFVVWRKDGLPAYQLASVVDDETSGIDCVVRGSDLLASSGAQAWLADRIGARRFREAVFLHHPLLLSGEGSKLSKSAGAESLRAWRGRGGPEPLLRGFAAWLGIDPSGVRGAGDLVPAFAPERVPRADRSWPEFRAGLGPA